MASNFANFELISPKAIPRGYGLWTLEGRLKSSLSSFPVRMSVIKSINSLLLVSSFPPTSGVLAALGQLGGEVRLVLAPNVLHCLWGAAARDAFPRSKLVGPPNAANRFPGLKWDALVDSAEELEGLLSEAGFAGGDLQAFFTSPAMPWIQEILLVHKPSATLILTDLAFNFKRGGETPLPGGPIGAIFRNTYLPLAGGYRPCCASKPWGVLLRLTGDPEKLSAILAEVMACDFDQVVLAHGDIVHAPDGKAALREGTVAMVKELVEAQRRRREGQAHFYTELAVGAVALAAVGAGVWRLVRGS